MTMTWRKSPEQLVETFLAALPDDPRIERRKMFGYPCAFVNGNMFTGLHQENLIVRLGEEDRRTLVEKEGAHIFAPFPGRLMKEYVSLPEELITTPRTLQAWLRLSLEHTASLPPKGAKKAASSGTAKKTTAPKKTAPKKAGPTPAKKKAAPRKAPATRR